MTLVIREYETQRAFVARVLREQGSISAHEAMFDLVDENGRKRSITRLAPAIDDLRHKSGWDIATELEHGQQAVYRLRSRPSFGHPAGALRICPSCHREHAVGTTCGVAA